MVCCNSNILYNSNTELSLEWEEEMIEIEVNNRFWVMKKLPEGNDFESALEIKEENKLIIPEGCFATKNKYLSMDAGTRMYMTEREDSYQPPIPVGEKLMGTVLGEVIESNHPEYKKGDVLRSYGQWSDYSLVDPTSMYPSKVDTSNIDLIDYDNRKLEGDIILPHPRMHTRNFVLMPMYELDKDWKHPILKHSIKKLILSLSNKDLRSIKQI